MFVTKNQFYIFIACLAIGGVFGSFCSFSASVKFFIKNKFLKAFCDVFASFFLSVIFVLFSFYLRFSNLKLYMLCGVFIGIYLYLKSFHIILAKYAEKIYNIYKSKRKKLSNDRIKSKKVDRRRYGRRSSVGGNPSIGNDLSTDIHFGISKTH